MKQPIDAIVSMLKSIMSQFAHVKCFSYTTIKKNNNNFGLYSLGYTWADL